MENSKLDGEMHYNNKFINKIEPSRRHGKYKHTKNTYSYTGSRPIHENGVMQYKRLTERDVVNYKAIDYVPGNDAYRKTGAPKIISLETRNKNPQNHHVYIDQKEVVDPYNKLVYLSQISPYMYIATFNTVFKNENAFVTDKGIHTVINLGNAKLCSSNYKKIYNIKFKDIRTVNYRTFMSMVRETIALMESCIAFKEKFVVCCDKGVNRSIAMAIAFNLLNDDAQITTLKETIEYIIKKKDDPTWPVLNNLTFYHYLDLIERANTQFRR